MPQNGIISLGGRGGNGIAGSPHASRALIAGNGSPQDQQMYFTASVMSVIIRKIGHGDKTDRAYAILWDVTEQWFIVDNYPGLTVDAVPVEDPLPDTGRLDNIEVDVSDKPDVSDTPGEPKALDALPRLIEVGEWRICEGDPGTPPHWKDAVITRPDLQSLYIKNDSTLWTLDVYEESIAGTLLSTGNIPPGESLAYPLPVQPEMQRTPGFGILFHFDRPDESESLVLLRKK